MPLVTLDRVSLAYGYLPLLDDAIKAIVEAARTGEFGDGRVFVLPVLESYRIRTGERES